MELLEDNNLDIREKLSINAFSEPITKKTNIIQIKQNTLKKWYHSINNLS